MKIIEFENVSVKYQLYHEKIFTLKEQVLNFLKGKGRIKESFLALDNISFSINQGEIVGIIGENGSGKSTILKLMAQVFTHTSGKIKIHGKISTLIELGAGFNPELTGLENIFLNGAILGFSTKRIKERLDKIVSFAELEHFIDIPVKYYSSGMYMRLAFSIAIDVDPEILLIDEILAVGDQSFQNKCFLKIEEFKKRKKTIILVSHDMDLVKKICNRTLLLHQGKIIKDTSPDVAIETYFQLLKR